jgi:hypothetical protein
MLHIPAFIASSARISILSMLLLLAQGCKKDALEISYTTERLPLPINIQSVHISSGHIYAAGGLGGRGYLFGRAAASTEWSLMLESPKRINKILPYGGKLYLLCDSTGIIMLDPQTGLAQPPFNYQYFLPWPKTISDITNGLFIQDKLVAVAARNQVNGNIYISYDIGHTLYIDYQGEQGFYGAAEAAGDVFICGYGTIARYSLDTRAAAHTGATGDIFTGIDYRAGTLAACGFAGTVIYSRDYGASWHKSDIEKNTGTRLMLNSICFITENKLIAAGEKGKIILSTDRAASWQQVKYSGTEKLLAVAADSTTVIAAGSNGQLIFFNL